MLRGEGVLGLAARVAEGVLVQDGGLAPLGIPWLGQQGHRGMEDLMRSGEEKEVLGGGAWSLEGR